MIKINDKKILSVIFWIIASPIVLFEYLVLWWFWAGDGGFNKTFTPIFFIIYLAIQLVTRRNIKNKALKLILLLTTVFATPFITMVTVDFVADIFGVDNAVAVLQTLSPS